jgi:hypothetical protein
LPRKNSENAATAYRKPRIDIYTVLLAVALVAILLAIYGLYLEMDDFKFELKGGPPVSWVSTPAPAIAACSAVPVLGVASGSTVILSAANDLRCPRAAEILRCVQNDRCPSPVLVY